MKNAIVTLFKTLFFFDVAVVAVFFLPYKKAGTDALTALSKETVFFAVAAVLTFLFLFFVEKRKIKVFCFKNVFRHYSAGLLYGIFPLAVTVAFLWLTKHLRFTGKTETAHIALWLAALFVNTLATELLFRGYLFRLYREHYGFFFAALFVSVLFFSFHYPFLQMGKLYVANLLLLNILLCIAADKTGSFIAPLTAHFLYRLISVFALGSLPLEGFPYLFKTSVSGKTWLTGGEKGLEASCVLLLLQAAVIVWYARKALKGKKIQLPPFLAKWFRTVDSRIKRRKAKKAYR